MTSTPLCSATSTDDGLTLIIQDQANRLREQLDESDLARERLEATISEAHNDLAKARIEMNELREKIKKFENNSENIDQTSLRLRVELEEEQREVERLTGAHII